MKTFKAAAMTAAFAMVGAMGMAALPQAAMAQITPQQEAMAHPRIVQAIKHMEAAYALMQDGSERWEGNKEQAMADTRAAIHSLRKALFYRLRWDDAQIDRFQF